MLPPAVLAAGYSLLSSGTERPLILSGHGTFWLPTCAIPGAALPGAAASSFGSGCSCCVAASSRSALYQCSWESPERPPSPTSRGPAGGSSPQRGPCAGRSRSARHRSDDRDRGQCAGCIRTRFSLGHYGSCRAVRTSMPGCGNMFPHKPERAVPGSRRIAIPLMIGRRGQFPTSCPRISSIASPAPGPRPPRAAGEPGWWDEHHPRTGAPRSAGADHREW